MRLKNQLVTAAENYVREENLYPVLIQTISKDMEEKVKLVHMVVDLVDREKRKICVTLLGYNVDQSESSFNQVLLYASRKEHEKF